jgi:hypothetical protein
MNLGPVKLFVFSVSINSRKSEATAKQLGAYESNALISQAFETLNE